MSHLFLNPPQGEGMQECLSSPLKLIRGFNITTGKALYQSPRTLEAMHLSLTPTKEIWREAKPGELLFWNRGESSFCNSFPSNSRSKNM